MYISTYVNYDLQQTAILYFSTSNIVGNISNAVLTSMNIKSFMNLYPKRKNIQVHRTLKTAELCHTSVSDRSEFSIWFG